MGVELARIVGRVEADLPPESTFEHNGDTAAQHKENANDQLSVLSPYDLEVEIAVEAVASVVVTGKSADKPADDVANSAARIEGELLQEAAAVDAPGPAHDDIDLVLEAATARAVEAVDKMPVSAVQHEAAVHTSSSDAETAFDTAPVDAQETSEAEIHKAPLDVLLDLGEEPDTQVVLDEEGSENEEGSEHEEGGVSVSLAIMAGGRPLPASDTDPQATDLDDLVNTDDAGLSTILEDVDTTQFVTNVEADLVVPRQAESLPIAPTAGTSARTMVEQTSQTVIEHSDVAVQSSETWPVASSLRPKGFIRRALSRLVTFVKSVPARLSQWIRR